MPRRARAITAALFATAAIGLLGASPVAAHGFTSVVYADITGSGDGTVRAELQLEYDLLVVSAADAEQNDQLYQDGTAAFEGGYGDEQVAALQDHLDDVLAYVAPRFTIESAGEQCVPSVVGDISMTEQQEAPYAVLVLDYACAESTGAHLVTSTLFPDSEEYVIDTKTILQYSIDSHDGSAALDAATPSFSTEQSVGERFWEFFHLGAEHLLGGIDHILFLLALIAGSRRLREVVLAATSFTVAHSVTFILASTGVVSAPAEIVEPIIALSIAVVAGWHLWQLWRRRDSKELLDTVHGPLGLDRAGWLRLAIVFLFGLVHGVGFASALGIDEPWSWTLLWSLLVFNLGIEVVQLALIAAIFPLLTLLRRRSPRVGRWVTGAVAVVVAIAGLVWFVQRILGL